MREFVQAWTDAFREHRLLTYATAIALRALICFVSLTFLALALLGAVGQRDVWQRHIAPAIEPKVTHPTFVAINAAAEKVFASNSAGLIVFALLYALWQMSGSLRAVMDAPNAIVDCDEKRPTLYRYGLSVALAAVAIALIACALFARAGADRLLGPSGRVSHRLIAVLPSPAGTRLRAVAVGIGLQRVRSVFLRVLIAGPFVPRFGAARPGRASFGTSRAARLRRAARDAVSEHQPWIRRIRGRRAGGAPAGLSRGKCTALS